MFIFCQKQKRISSYLKQKLSYQKCLKRTKKEKSTVNSTVQKRCKLPIDIYRNKQYNVKRTLCSSNGKR